MRKINTAQYRKAQNNLALLTKVLNVKIFNAIGFGEKNQTELIIGLRKFEQATVSTYVRNLVKLGWLYQEKRGKFVYYTLNKERLQSVTETASKLAQFWS